MRYSSLALTSPFRRSQDENLVPHRGPRSCLPDTSAALDISFFFLGRIVLYLFYFFNFWLCWVFVSVQGLPLVAASGGHSSSRCVGLSLSRLLSLRSTGSRRAGSVVVAYGPSCSAACGIFPDQGSNPCPLHWQADSQPLRHQGSPRRLSFPRHVKVVQMLFLPLSPPPPQCSQLLRICQVPA